MNQQLQCAAMSSINILAAGVLPTSLNSDPLPSRIAGIDLARTIALLGMVFVNFRHLMGTDDYWSLWLLRLSDWLVGRPAVTFIILAGIGISLLKNSRAIVNSIHPSTKLYLTILKRAVSFFVMGLLFSCVWHADILHFYGIYFAVAVLLVNASDRMLFIFIGAALVNSILLTIPITLITPQAIDSVWNPAYWTQKGLLGDLFVSGFFPVFPWIVYFLFGIWLGRQNLSDCRLQKKLILIAAQIIVICEVAVSLLEILLRFAGSMLTNNPMLIFLIQTLDTSPFSSSILSVFSASGTALLVIILSLKFATRAGLSKWLKPFRATSQMSLTLYIVHIGIIQLFLLMCDEGEMETSLEEAWILAMIFCLLLILFATYWVNHFGRGPLEKILRWGSK